MSLSVNGAPAPVPSPATVGALVAAMAHTTSRGIAVALNGEVVPRSAWDATGLQPGHAPRANSAIPRPASYWSRDPFVPRALPMCGVRPRKPPFRGLTPFGRALTPFVSFMRSWTT